MLFDTDVLIWCLRGNARAARAVEQADHRATSLVNYLELLQGAQSRKEVQAIRSFLSAFQFHTVPLSENIGHRAAVYMETHRLGYGLGLADALIAATAVESGLSLLTGNGKHFRAVADLEVTPFRA